MSLTLNEIHDRFPNWVGEISFNALHVYKSCGLPIGCLYQDRTRCIYESYVYGDYLGQDIHTLENTEFLSYFKRRFLLKIKDTPTYKQYIYILQKIL